MNNFYYKVRTYGLFRITEYAFIEIAGLIRRLFWGSYSQKGEDLFLSRMFPKHYEGFYVDVGANDPIRFNNTYKFYKRGWKGMNIEPDANNYKKLKEVRAKDININIGIDETEGDVEYYHFIPSTLNTFSNEECENYLTQGYKLEKVEMIPVRRLDDVLEENLPKGTKIDLLTIDTEGFDLKVLKSANLEKWCPSYICVESCRHGFSNPDYSITVEETMEKFGYKKVFSNGLNSVFSYIH